jgi:ubiquinone/menaquinone biosynthesis C-methylase UbiE
MRQSVEWNQMQWDVKYSWIDGGDNWSEPWGGPEKQWHGVILPRIRAFLPAHTCLEIAPGYGRWTQFLKDACVRLIVVDLSNRCITACRKRFANCSHIEYFVNDGESLAMVPDESIDFAFSFDSLVHVEADVLEAYLQELARKLTKDGVGFIHHSNLEEYRKQLWYRRIPLPRSIAKRVGASYRTFSVTAAKFDEIAQHAGLRCINQELINWKQHRLSDCLSTFTRLGSRWPGPNEIRRNSHFMDEARRIRETSFESVVGMNRW